MSETYATVSTSDSFGNNVQRNIGKPSQRESVESIGSIYTKLSKHICELVIRCADTLDVSPDNLGVVESADLTHICTILKTYLEQIIQAYSVSCQEAKIAKEENNRIRFESSAKIKLISDLENRLSTYKKQFEMLHSRNNILEQRNEMFRKQLDQYKKDVRRLNKEHSKAKASLENLQRQYEQTKRVNEEKVNRLTHENSSMENQLAGFRQEMRKHSEEKAKLERGDRKVSELMEKLQEKAVKIEELEKINEKLLMTIGRRFQEGETCESQDEEACRPSMHSQFMNENYKLKECMAQMVIELNQKLLKNHKLVVNLAASENNFNELKLKLYDIARKYDSLKREHDVYESVINAASRNEVPTQEKTRLELQYEEQLKAMKNELEVLQSQNLKFEDQIRAILKSTFKWHGYGQGDEILPDEIDNPIEYLQERINFVLSNNSHLSKSHAELRNAVSELKKQGVEISNSGSELSAACEKLKADLMLSEKKIQSLESEIQDKTAIIVKLTQKVEEQREQDKNLADTSIAPCLQEGLRLFSAEKETLMTEIAVLRTEEEALHSKVKHLETQVESQMKVEVTLRNKVADSENYIIEITEELRALQHRLGESDAFADSLKEEKEHLNGILQNLSQSTDFKKVKISALRKENLELLEQVQKLNKEVAFSSALKRELKFLKQQNTSLTQNIEEKEAVAQADLKEIHRLKDLLELRNSDQQHLQNVLATRDQQILSLENEVSGLKCSLEQNMSTVRELQYLIENIEVEYNRTAESFKLKIDSLENEKADLENSNRTLLDKVIKLGNNIRVSNAANESLLGQLKKATENTVSKAEFVNIQLKYVSICAEKEKLEMSKNQLEVTCESLSKRIEMLTVQIKKLQESAEILQMCNETSRGKIQTLHKAFSNNKLQNEDLQARLIAVQEKLRTTTTEMLNLQELYKKETTITSTLSGQLDIVYAKIERTCPQMDQELRIATDNVVNLKKLYEHESEKSSDLLNEIQKLRNMLDIKQQELSEQTSILSETKLDLENKLEAIKEMNTELLTIKRLNEEVQEENSALLRKSEVLTLLENKLNQTQNALDFLNEQCAASKMHMEELNNSKFSLIEEISQLTISNQELQVQVQQYSTMLSEVGDSLKMSKAENAELQEENIQLKLSLRNLHQALSSSALADEQPGDFKQEFKNFKNNYEQLLENIIELRNSKVQIHDQSTKLSSELNMARNENKQLVTKVSELSSTLQNLEKEHNELCNDLRSLQERCATLTNEKFAKDEEHAKILTILNELELRRNDMLRSHNVSIEELNGRLRQYDEMQEELHNIKAEKKVQEEELLSQQDKLTRLEEKLKTIDDLARQDREMNKQQKKDVAILQAKLLKSRQILEQNQKQWECQRSKLLTKIQETEQKFRDTNNETKNRFENMKNKDTQCCTVNLSRIDLMDTLMYKGDNATETYAALQILSQSELQTVNFCPSKYSFDWKKRCLRAIKYPFAVVVFNMVLTFLLRYTLSRNNLEIVVRRTVPTMILERESII